MRYMKLLHSCDMSGSTNEVISRKMRKKNTYLYIPNSYKLWRENIQMNDSKGVSNIHNILIARVISQNRWNKYLSIEMST